MQDPEGLLTAAAKLLAQHTPQLDRAQLLAYVQGFIDRREAFLEIARRHGCPLYVLDRPALLSRARQFTEAFRRVLPESRVYYAVKSNNCPQIAAALVEAGVGLDVSSGLELQLALDCGASDIVFSGPGKSDTEHDLAAANGDRVTVLIDSFGELERLEQVAARQGVVIRSGVRLTTAEHGLWRKFGVMLSELPRFFEAADRCSHVRLCGIQFHTSWNMDATRQVHFIRLLAEALGGLKPVQRAAVAFLDIGGGFWPPEGEWLQAAGTPEGRVRRAVEPDWQAPLAHHRVASRPIEEFAEAIGQAVRQHIFPHVRCCICAEPGRWLCNDSMHLLMTVVDRKADDLVITDAGTNAIGWERFETDYFPVINLTQPDLTERPCMVMGSLCTPHDLWGYGYFGRGIRDCDVLLIPSQGAYTYSLRQEFIKPLPRVVTLDKGNQTQWSQSNEQEGEQEETKAVEGRRKKPVHKKARQST